jgi:hypothetical protein
MRAGGFAPKQHRNHRSTGEAKNLFLRETQEKRDFSLRSKGQERASSENGWAK